MEIWKDIEGYEGLYQVSSLGNIKSLERSILNKNGKPQRYPEKLLKFDLTKMENTTYYRVTLSKNHVTTRYLVHRLVASAFINNPSHKPFINHIDNDGTNNSINNLEWCTHSENMKHAQNQGRLFNAQSKGGKLGSIKEVQAAIIKSQSIVGNIYGNWEVLKPLGKQGKGKGKYYVECICRGCSSTHSVEVGRLLRNETTQCRKCGQAKRKI
ncbi:HNH endonuclease [Vibrio phage JSF3]|uniref:HNH endonuclease n=1 Tax=Vibrio phage JSF3 TaxID=1916111 RepID=UPI000B60A34B|nr:HNH endonuclease [Vibrio phage JSF3]APD18057.1 HNH homing endonuclease [Vibrio phage JSF3]